MKIRTKATCVECGRVFDLADETDAEEWAYGHDCEPERPKSVTAFTIKASDIARCPDHNMSAKHWRPDGTCKHDRTGGAVNG